MDSQNRLSLFRNRSALVLFFIIFIGFLLRLPNLNESFWYDELWSTHLKLGSLRSLGMTALADAHPPFYSIFMFIWINLFGDSELAARMPSLILGVSSIFLVYVLANRVAERNTALLAAFLLSVSPVHIWYSQEARAYSALLFFLLISIIAYLKLSDDPVKPGMFLVYFLALFACVLTHYYLTAYLVMISALSLLTGHPQRRRILIMNAVIALCLLAWILLKVAFATLKTSQGDWRPFTIPDLWKLFFNWFLLGNSWDANKYYWGIITVQLFFAVLLARGLVLLFLQSDRTKHSREVLLYLFILPVSLLVFTFAGFNNYIERSVFVALPFFFITLARGATGLQSKAIRYACMPAVILVSAITVAAFFSRQDEWTVYKPNPDWRSAARYLEGEINLMPSASLIIRVTPADELMYYNPRFKKASTLDNIQERPGDGLTGNGQGDPWAILGIGGDHSATYERIAERNTPRFYLIHNKYWTGGFQSVFDDLTKDSRFQYQGMEAFKGLDVHAFGVTSQSNREPVASSVAVKQ